MYPVAKFRADSTVKTTYPKPVDDEVVYDGEVGGVRMWILASGYVVLDSDNRRKSLEICNCLFLSVSLLGRNRLYPMDENEFDVVSFDASSSPMLQAKQTKIGSIRGVIGIFDDVRREISDDRIVYPASVLRIMVELGNKIHASVYRDRILLFYEAWQAVNIADWMAGLLLSWICFEMWVYEETRLYLQNLGVSREKSKRILDLNISQLLLLLSAEAETGRFPNDNSSLGITADDLRKGERLRVIRNRVAHDGVRPSEQEANDCRLLANKSLWRYFRLSSISYTPMLEKVRELLGPSSRGDWQKPRPIAQ